MRRIIAAVAAAAVPLAFGVSAASAASHHSRRASCLPTLRRVEHVARQAGLSMWSDSVKPQPGDYWFVELDVAMNEAPGWYAPHLRAAVSAAHRYQLPATAQTAGTFVTAMRAAEAACPVKGTVVSG